MEAFEIKNIVLASLAAIGTCIANALGGWDLALAILIGLMAADYLTGIIVALVFHASPKTNGGGLASGECFKGLFRKCIVLVFVWLGAMLDGMLGAAYVRTAIIIFYIGNEGLSLIENTAYMGVPYPKFLKNALEAMKDRGDEPEAGNDVK
ncbi:MAG: phage holin family protein [Oscillospiraceae bacterium]